MKILNFVIILLLLSNSLFGQVSDKKYFLSKYLVIANSDTVVYYSRDSLHNIWDLSNIEYSFYSNESYSSKSINGTQLSGSWKQINNKFVTDSDTSDIISIDSYKIVLKNGIKFKLNNIVYEGDVITELINYIYTVNSGAWNNIEIWSCNCIPTENDNVLIKRGFSVSLTQQMGYQKCKNLTVELGSVFINNGSLFIAKP